MVWTNPFEKYDVKFLQVEVNMKIIWKHQLVTYPLKIGHPRPPWKGTRVPPICEVIGVQGSYEFWHLPPFFVGKALKLEAIYSWTKMFREIRTLQYCWWFRNPANSPVEEKVVFYPIQYKVFLHPGLWRISSSNSMAVYAIYQKPGSRSVRLTKTSNM